MIRAIVFDFDGVIVESADVKTRAFAELFREEGPDVVDRVVEHHLSNEGISRFAKFRHIFADILQRPLSAEQEAVLGERFSEIALEQIVAAPFVPGALEFLESHADAMPLFVASGTPEAELLDIIGARSLGRFFVEVHGSPKAKADVLRGVMERYGLAPGEVLFVGDAESDRRAAAETGVRFVARVSDGSGKAFDGEQRIRDLSELPGVLAAL